MKEKMATPNKLYKFRPLADCNDFCRIKDIIKNGFYCCDFLNFNDMNEGVFSINTENIDIGLLNKQKYKICSFSGEYAFKGLRKEQQKEQRKRQLMWGHYANAGMGVAIEVEVNNCKNIEPVIYKDDYEKLNSIEEILTHKTTEWEYEDEFRYIKKTSKKTIKIGKITKIYFGRPYRGLTNYDKIKEKHTKLRKYRELKKELKRYIRDTNSKRKNNKICCRNYNFDKITNKSFHLGC